MPEDAVDTPASRSTTDPARPGTGHRDALASLAATLLPPEAGGPDPHRLAEILDGYLAGMPAPTGWGVGAGVSALDAAARLVGRHGPLHTTDLATRERAIDALRRTGPTTHLLEGLKALVLLAHGADDQAPALRERSARTPLARPDPPMDVTPATAWPSTSTADVVVVGSGAGGAIVALELARAGLATVVVEEGRAFSVDEFRDKHPLRRWRELYRDAGATAALGNPPVLLPIGRGVGGSTLVNSGTCFHAPDRVLARWRDRHGVPMTDPAEFHELQDMVDTTLQVAPVPMDVMGDNGRRTLAGAEALGWSSGPLDRNAPGCVGSCQCALGCPRNAKAGVHHNALPAACRHGTRIVSEARVERVLHDDGGAVGVRARRRDGRRLTIRAPRVVVACGTTETPPLLRRSGLGRHPELGRNLAIHPAVGVAGRFDEPVVSWRGVLQSAKVDAFHESDGIMLEATAMPPGMGSIGMPGYGPRLVRELARADHYGFLGGMVGDQPSGSVHRLGDRTVIRYRLARTDGQRLMKAIALMGRVMFAAGAREVVTGLPHRPTVEDTAQLDEALARTHRRDLHLSAFHPTGTARMGGDAQTSPLTADGQVRGVRGVWVADGAVVPSCPEVNPQVTIMAFALGIARRIATTT